MIILLLSSTKPNGPLTPMSPMATGGAAANRAFESLQNARLAGSGARPGTGEAEGEAEGESEGEAEAEGEAGSPVRLRLLPSVVLKM